MYANLQKTSAINVEKMQKIENQNNQLFIVIILNTKNVKS
jgi:hypothetical protein